LLYNNNNSNGYYNCALAKIISFEQIDDTPEDELDDLIKKMETAGITDTSQIERPEFTNSVDVAIFIVNSEHYKSGVAASDCGKWVVLPIDDAEEIYEELGVEDFSECHIIDSDNEFKDIWKITEKDDIDDVNEAVEIVEYMSNDQIDCVKAVVEAGFDSFEEAAWKVKQNKYSLSKHITTAEQYAIEAVQDGYEIPDFLDGYINYEKLGEDWIQENYDIELTDYGLVRRN
jgi:hypothetical protein